MPEGNGNSLGRLYVREMRREDLDAVAEIETISFSEPWSKNSFSVSLQSPDTLYVAAFLPGDGMSESGDVPSDSQSCGGSAGADLLAGYAGLLRSFEEADITNVAVHPSWRGKGVGRLLLSSLMEKGREQGIRRFTLEVRKSNACALHLYESLGFRTVGIRKNFYSFPTEDACIMWTDEPE